MESKIKTNKNFAQKVQEYFYDFRPKSEVNEVNEIRENSTAWKKRFLKKNWQIYFQSWKFLSDQHLFCNLCCSFQPSEIYLVKQSQHQAILKIRWVLILRVDHYFTAFSWHQCFERLQRKRIRTKWNGDRNDFEMVVKLCIVHIVSN